MRTLQTNQAYSVSAGVISGFIFCLIFWLFLALFCVKTAHGDNRVTGQDHLASQQINYRSGYAGKFLPAGAAVGTLDYTFGTDVSHIRDLLRYSNPLYFRIHILNTVCVRNRNCGDYELTSGYSVSSLDSAVKAKQPKIIKPFSARVKLYCALRNDFPTTRFIISPALEHDLSKESVRVLIDTILDICPNVMVDNNPEFITNAERYRGCLFEGHSNTPGSVEISSLDGTEGTDIDVPRWLQRTSNNLITFFWSRGYNCRNQGDWEDPRARDSCSSPDLIQGFNHIMEDKGSPPAAQFPCQFKSFKAPSIWKPLAEDSGTGDTRANLPVLIMTGSRNPVTVLAVNGKSVGKLAYYGSYNETQNRYYSGYGIGSRLTGWGFEKKAAAQGSNYVWLKQDKTCYGPIISSRRQGVFK